MKLGLWNWEIQPVAFHLELGIANETARFGRVSIGSTYEAKPAAWQFKSRITVNEQTL
jgi:hypothetical protein